MAHYAARRDVGWRVLFTIKHESAVASGAIRERFKVNRAKEHGHCCKFI
jgi:hypothetical protein